MSQPGQNTNNKVGTHSGKKTANGGLYFGDKDAAYLKKVSREAVEIHHDAPILYFEIDWIGSKRNFYGEMLVKKFKNPKGTQVRGIYKIEQSKESTFQSIPYKLMSLTVSLYVEQLKELNIEPKIGEYFSVGNRYYMIWDKTIEDVGPGNLLMNKERIRQDFMCTQEENEVIFAKSWGEELGNQSEINQSSSELGG